MKFRNMFLKYGYQSQAGEEPGGAGVTFTQAQLDEAVAKAVAEQTAGLKAKNGEVIGDNKKLKEQLAKFDGIDPEQVRAILKNFADGEEARLIAEGKIDEVLAKRTDKLKGEHQKQLQGRDEQIGTLSARVRRLSDLAVGGALAAAAGAKGALPESMEAVKALAKGVFVTDDEGNVVALDGDGDVVFGKDGKSPLQIDEWMDGLKERMPNLFAQPKGAGANGSGTQRGASGNLGGTQAEQEAYFAQKFGLPNS
ncbi:hypothetical protein [Neisseria bacilliformis]|uniref:hypothetical protein n=1 Tax=Neisseria bacilliformis TaxID=267212 RepID=UPI0028E87CEB|nr:hypothetical protein [Neisseria bacilliformis]